MFGPGVSARPNEIRAKASRDEAWGIFHSRQERPAFLERDDFSSNRHLAQSFCLSMISAQTLRVCREGKPVPTFPDHALACAAPRDHVEDDMDDGRKFQG